MNFKSKCKTNNQKFKPCSDKILIPQRREIKMNKRDNLKDILYLMGLTQILLSQQIKPSKQKDNETDKESDNE
ncbi:6898_t:CDS:1, partial [Scutellospora calospora]